MARSHHPDLWGRNISATGFNSDHGPIAAPYTGHFAVFNDIHAVPVSCPCKSPGKSIVPGHPAAGLERCAEYRVARPVGDINQGNDGLDLSRGQDLAVDSIQSVCVRTPDDIPHILQGMPQIQDPPLAEHHVEIEFLAEPLPQLQGFFVKLGCFIPQVVGSHNRRVATRVTATDPALLQNCYPSNRVFTGEVIRTRKPVTTASNDDDIILRTRFGTAPGLPPARVPGH